MCYTFSEIMRVKKLMLVNLFQGQYAGPCTLEKKNNFAGFGRLTLPHTGQNFLTKT